MMKVQLFIILYIILNNEIVIGIKLTNFEKRTVNNPHLQNHRKKQNNQVRGGGVGGGNGNVNIKNTNTGTNKNAKNVVVISELSRRYATVALVFTALFNDMLQLTMLLPIIPTLISSPPPLGVKANPEIAMGIFFASKDMCQLAFAPLAGWLTARTSSNVALALSTAGLAFATFIFAEATTFKSLLFARSCQGAASAAVMCGGLSLIAETHPIEIRGSAMAKAYTGLALGVLSGPLIGGLLFDKFGRRKTFRYAAIFVLINAMLQLGLMIFMPPVKYNTSDTLDDNKEESSALESFRLLYSNPQVLVVAGAIFCINAVLGTIKPLSQLILHRDFGMNTLNRSFIITIATFTYLIGTPIAGYLSDRMPRPTLLAFSLLLCALSGFCFALCGSISSSIWFLNISIAILGVSLAFSGSVSTALLADLVDRYKLGKYSMAFALSDMADSLGLIIGPVVGLTISQYLGPSVATVTMGTLCLVIAPLVFRIPSPTTSK